MIPPYAGTTPPGLTGSTALRWTLGRTLSLAEWDAAVLAGFCDIATLPTGAVLQDIAVVPHPDFNDSDGDGATVGPFGWGHDAGSFDWPLTGPLDGVTFMVGHTAVFDASPGVYNVARLAGSPGLGSLNVYGPPAFVFNGPAMGPLQAIVVGGGESSGQGNVQIWLLLGGF